MKIGDLARQTGLSVHTIRYYEKIGLLPKAHRDGGGRRQYGMEITNWLSFLRSLKSTGMGIADMLRYARLRAEGPHTAPDRKAMLEARHRLVKERIRELEATLPVLEKKIAFYSDDSQAHIMEADHDQSSNRVPRLSSQQHKED